MKARFNIIVKNHIIKKGTETEIIEAQYITSLKKTYYTVKTSTGFVYHATKRGLLKQYKNVILPNPEKEQPKEKAHPKLNNGQLAKVQPNLDHTGEQIQLF